MLAAAIRFWRGRLAQPPAALPLRLGGHDEALPSSASTPRSKPGKRYCRQSCAWNFARSGNGAGWHHYRQEMAEARLGVGMGDIIAASSRLSHPLHARRRAVKRGQSQLGSTSGYVLLREAQSMLGRPAGDQPGRSSRSRIRRRMSPRRLEQRLQGGSWQERSGGFPLAARHPNVIMYSVVS